VNQNQNNRTIDEEAKRPGTTDRDKEADSATEQDQKLEPIVRKISEFFANSEISPAAFSKALKANKVLRFKQEDADKVMSALEADTDGNRLWSLMSQANLPEAVDRWIWSAAQVRLKAVVGPEFNPQEKNSTEILQILGKAFGQQLRSRDKAKARAAENWLRIGICWLVEKRTIETWTIGERLSSDLFADKDQAISTVRRAISKGSSKELKLSVAAVALGNDLVTRSKKEQAEGRLVSENLREKLIAADRKIEELSANLYDSRAEIAQKEEALKGLQSQFEDERHHWGHDLSKSKAGQRVLLGERVAPLISDAIDALEIDPPAQDLALRRIKAVLKLIDEASE